jgi:hypothetical protein
MPVVRSLVSYLGEFCFRYSDIQPVKDTNIFLVQGGF